MYGVASAVITAAVVLVTTLPGLRGAEPTNVAVPAIPQPDRSSPDTEDPGEHRGHEGPQRGWGFSPTFTLGDIAEALALPLTIILAYVTLRKSARDQRELTMLREALNQLSLLITLANEASQMVESNLRNPTSDHKVQQRNTEQIRKRLDCELLIAAAFLTDAEAMELKLAHKDWYDSTFCESWPRTKLTGPLGPGDSQLVALFKGRNDWCRHVIQLKKKQVTNPCSFK